MLGKPSLPILLHSHPSGILLGALRAYWLLVCVWGGSLLPGTLPADVTISLLHGAQLTNGLRLTVIMGPSNRL